MNLGKPALKFVLLVAVSCLPVAPQDIVSAGYQFPLPVVAPGQVITLFVQGLKAQAARADRLPLPTSLNGVSVLLTQTQAPIALPIFSIGRVDTCFAQRDGFVCGNLSLITVQIPFELGFNIPGTLRPPIFSELVVSEEGRIGSPIAVGPGSDKIKVIVVTHADGGPLSKVSPAKAGETLVMYAVGLGATLPRVATGAAAPMPPAGASAGIHFDFRPNAPPMRPFFSPATFDPSKLQAPDFAGLVPGFVGLYQINFTVPEVPRGTPPCDTFANSPFPAVLLTVLSNLTVTIYGQTSFDGAGICVQP